MNKSLINGEKRHARKKKSKMLKTNADFKEDQVNNIDFKSSGLDDDKQVPVPVIGETKKRKKEKEIQRDVQQHRIINEQEDELVIDTTLLDPNAPSNDTYSSVLFSNPNEEDGKTFPNKSARSSPVLPFTPIPVEKRTSDPLSLSSNSFSRPSTASSAEETSEYQFY